MVHHILSDVIPSLVQHMHIHYTCICGIFAGIFLRIIFVSFNIRVSQNKIIWKLAVVAMILWMGWFWSNAHQMYLFISSCEYALISSGLTVWYVTINQLIYYIICSRNRPFSKWFVIIIAVWKIPAWTISHIALTIWLCKNSHSCAYYTMEHF